MVREYWESTGNIYRVRVYQSTSKSSNEVFTVKMHDTATNDLEGTIVLQHFANGKWVEKGAGETLKAHEYGKFIDDYSRLYQTV